MAAQDTRPPRIILPDDPHDLEVQDVDTGEIHTIMSAPTRAVYKTSLGKRVYATAYLDLLPIPGISPETEVREEVTMHPWVRVQDRRLKDYYHDISKHLELGLCVHSRIEFDSTSGISMRGFRGDTIDPNGHVLYTNPEAREGWLRDTPQARRALVAALNAACDWCDMEKSTRTTRFICRRCAEGLHTIRSDGLCADCRKLHHASAPTTSTCPRCGGWAKSIHEMTSKSGNTIHACNRCRLRHNCFMTGTTLD
jgi:hypothetical protein